MPLHGEATLVRDNPMRQNPRFGAAARHVALILSLGPGLALWGPWLRPMSAAQAPAPPAAQAKDQSPAQPKGKPDAQENPAGRDLISRYRFTERYTNSADGNEEGLIGQYRVGIQENLHQGAETPTQAAAKRGEPKGAEAAEKRSPQEKVVQQTSLVYVDRPAEVSGLGQVKSLVRHYERARLTSNATGQLPGPNSLEGMSILLRPRTDDLPEIINLTPDKPLRESDYRFAALQLYVPNLTVLLPPSPLRIGDTWPISKLGVRTLAEGHRILAGGLAGTLVDVRTDPKTDETMAVFDISGRIAVQRGSVAIRMAVRARIEFTLARAREGGEKPSRSPKEEGTIEARGAITRLSMAINGTAMRDRAQSEVKRELVIERQLTGTGRLLSLPRDLPESTPENSWLTYVDPENRFFFQHPQELHQPQEYGLTKTTAAGVIELVHLRYGMGRDWISLEVLPKSDRKPEDIHKSVFADWKAKKYDMLEGSAGWMPEAAWPGMQVYRFEAVILAHGRSTQGVERVHFDGYVVHLKGNDLSLLVQSTTAQDAPLQFRKDVEAMLRTFQASRPPS